MGCVGGVLAGCGAADDEPGEPAAARDVSVQRAATSPAPASAPGSAAAAAERGVLRGTYPRLNGERDNLARYRGDVVLIVLGFPANDFAGQEPRSNDEIAEFCKATTA